MEDRDGGKKEQSIWDGEKFEGEAKLERTLEVESTVRSRANPAEELSLKG